MSKKKIIFINNHFQRSDGVCRAMIDLCNHLNPDLYDITILSLYRYEKELKKELHENVHLRKGFGFYFRGMNKFVSLLPPFWLYKVFVGDHYDIEIAFQCDMPTKIVCGQRHENKVQVAWMHGYQNYPEFYCNVDKVICVSKFNADRCREELPYKADVSYCYNLMDDAKICRLAQESVDIPRGNGPIMVSVGRISPEKGYLRLMDILSDLKKEGYAFRFMLVGEGPQMKDVMDKAVELSLEDCVFLKGRQDNPHKFTSKADLFICSSFSEGYSTACTEAAVLGIPILTTDVPGGREIIETCQAGAVVSLEDRDLKAGIKNILDHPEILQKWKCELQQTKHLFSMENRQETVDLLFEGLAGLSDQKDTTQDVDKRIL